MSKKMNKLIEKLDILIYQCEIQNDKSSVFKKKQYTDIIRLLKNYNNVFNKTNVIEYLNYNGKKSESKIVKKIIEYFDTDTILEADKALENGLIKAMKTFINIYGIGPKKAQELYQNYNISDINELRNEVLINPKIINDKQKLGLEYYEDLIKRIPRKEIDCYNNKIKSICERISKHIIYSINGSYRRKHADSGDIDILITSNDEDPTLLRNKLIDELIKAKIIIATLANGKKKFMGITKLNEDGYNIARHMDIMDTDPSTFPFAQLYFTGSGNFNSNMRSKALKLGYSLNEYCISDKKTKKPIDKHIILKKIGKPNFTDEKDIFEFLEMEYLEPENREINYIS